MARNKIKHEQVFWDSKPALYTIEVNDLKKLVVQQEQHGINWYN